jgi:hypothetical protein
MNRLAAPIAPALAASLAAAFALALGTAAANATTKRHPHHAAQANPAAYAQPYASQNSYAPQNYWGWRLASPNAAPISLFTYFRTHGYCVIDEGYGRATLCD